jgi:hypothetical protein
MRRREATGLWLKAACCLYVLTGFGMLGLPLFGSLFSDGESGWLRYGLLANLATHVAVSATLSWRQPRRPVDWVAFLRAAGVCLVVGTLPIVMLPEGVLRGPTLGAFVSLYVLWAAAIAPHFAPAGRGES